MIESETTQHFKDERLDELARYGNVAQFISFGPDLSQRFSRVRGFEPNYIFRSVEEAATVLLDRSPERKVNIRSFRPENPQGHEFIYGIQAANKVEQDIKRLTLAGLFVIVNETVDVDDGGVSGVAHGSVIEFAPGATPRVVESGSVCSVPRIVGERIIQTVYGFSPELEREPSLRIEFSVHPICRGYAQKHTIMWEIQELSPDGLRPMTKWPNAFSTFIGDKAFGLLLADAAELDVPRTIVVCRNALPFSFGEPTGCGVKWMRTCPATPEPGFFPTIRGWSDPFELMRNTPENERLSSVLIQDEVRAKYSGALLTDPSGEAIVEGVRGFGNEFMMGQMGPSRLDDSLVSELQSLHRRLFGVLGSVRAEWAYDGNKVWIIQLQQEAALSHGLTIVPGQVEQEYDFDVSAGLAGLRELVELIRGRNIGIRLVGNVGMTSHICDVLRRFRIPSRIVPNGVLR